MSKSFLMRTHQCSFWQISNIWYFVGCQYREVLGARVSQCPLIVDNSPWPTKHGNHFISPCGVFTVSIKSILSSCRVVLMIVNSCFRCRYYLVRIQLSLFYSLFLGIITNVHFVMWMSFLLIVNLGLILIPRPATIPLPTYANPSPQTLPIPSYNDVGWLIHTTVYLDQWLMLCELPLAGKVLVLFLSLLHWVIASTIDLLLIEPWRKEEQKKLHSSLSTAGGPIPSAVKDASVFHVLWI